MNILSQVVVIGHGRNDVSYTCLYYVCHTLSLIETMETESSLLHPGWLTPRALGLTLEEAKHS